MITHDENPSTEMIYKGLSTDTKPTGNIKNGTAFVEMDTGKLYFYDAEGSQWREFNSQGG